ncbi:hypothetical protein HK105_205977 [Polyrhizophydium stewartii]|uniref:Uncharacterized protein n=1 Tax=Polyrhizophydium stewartii TaxID=2732419 RepID=A0ABR4N4H9_9FUNG|nr:hypothetical protein HK105_005438 [Polyrhizophydium stewartii]
MATPLSIGTPSITSAPSSLPPLDIVTPEGGMFPVSTLERSQLSNHLAFDRQSAFLTKNNYISPTGMTTRTATMAIYERHNLH